MTNEDLLGLLLPEGLLAYFVATKVEKREGSYSIYLEEKNIIPEQYKNHKLTSNGFYEESTIQDFPLRGRACYLKVKRRRWMNHDLGYCVSRDWDLVANGTRMTKEFASFLKELNRYKPGKLQ